jgi:hypothetical protein
VTALQLALCSTLLEEFPSVMLELGEGPQGNARQFSDVVHHAICLVRQQCSVAGFDEDVQVGMAILKYRLEYFTVSVLYFLEPGVVSFDECVS